MDAHPLSHAAQLLRGLCMNATPPAEARAARNESRSEERKDIATMRRTKHLRGTCIARPTKAAAAPKTTSGDHLAFALSWGLLQWWSAILTVPAGALLGLAVAPGEKWHPSSPDRLSVRITPARGGAGLSVSLRF